MKHPPATRREVAALEVHQWLPEWDVVDFDANKRRRRPQGCFYLFSLSASDLKALCGIHRRSVATGTPRSEDTGIQRRHEHSRSEEIGRFIRFGYPWSDLSEEQREDPDFDDLRKPGWLPTAVVLNILTPADKRMGQDVAQQDLITIVKSASGGVKLLLPKGFDSVRWRPQRTHPLEVIDGQHRLWAFDEDIDAKSFELPVVAFQGLDISWQAYQFWTINIKPKKLNASLAFDLYPLLRTEDWLSRREGHAIYRETRAQELIESLWGHPESPWHQRINMLGEPGASRRTVTQAAWIRSLIASYIKSGEGPATRVGGLFGSEVGHEGEALSWNRAQQAAFLIFIGQELMKAVGNCHSGWAKRLRLVEPEKQASLLAEDHDEDDAAFFGQHTLLSTDQGIRGLLFITNDLCFVRADELELHEWSGGSSEVAATDQEAVSQWIRDVAKKPVGVFISAIAKSLAGFDWRSSSAPGLKPDELMLRKALRGSGGYRELRRQLLIHLSSASAPDVRDAAKTVFGLLGYEGE